MTTYNFASKKVDVWEWKISTFPLGGVTNQNKSWVKPTGHGMVFLFAIGAGGAGGSASTTAYGIGGPSAGMGCYFIPSFLMPEIVSTHGVRHPSGTSSAFSTYSSSTLYCSQSGTNTYDQLLSVGNGGRSGNNGGQGGGGFSRANLAFGTLVGTTGITTAGAGGQGVNTSYSAASPLQAGRDGGIITGGVAYAGTGFAATGVFPQVDGAPPNDVGESSYPDTTRTHRPLANIPVFLGGVGGGARLVGSGGAAADNLSNAIPPGCGGGGGGCGGTSGGSGSAGGPPMLRIYSW